MCNNSNNDGTCHQWELLGNGCKYVAVKKDLVSPISFGELWGQIE